MVDDREELEKYLETVVREVQRRQTLVQQLEGDIRELEGELRTGQGGRVIDARILQAQSGFRDTLLRNIEQKNQELKIAKEDLARARERESSVREDLLQFEE